MHWVFLLIWRVSQFQPLKNTRLLPAHFTVGMYSAGDEQSWFLQTWCLEVMSECPLGAFSKCVFFCLHWGEDWVWPHHYKAPIGGVLQWCLSFCIWSWSSTRETIGFLATTLSPSPSVARFGQETSSKKSPGFKLLPWRGTETTCFCDVWLDANLFLSSTDCAFDLRAWFVLWYALSAVRPLIKMFVPFQIIPS